MIPFSEWLAKRMRKGGSKLTATGLNAGGQAQAGMRFRHVVKPPKTPFTSWVKPVRF